MTSSEHAQQEWFRIRPIHLQKSQELQPQTAEFIRLLEQVGCEYGCVWVAPGAGAAARWLPLANDTASPSSKVQLSTVAPEVSLNTQFAGMAASSVIG